MKRWACRAAAPSESWRPASSGFAVSGLVAAGLEHDSDAERGEPVGEVAVVLFGQDLGRRHERDVVAAFQRHQRAAGRHGGFARADVALEQAAHRERGRRGPGATRAAPGSAPP